MGPRGPGSKVIAKHQNKKCGASNKRIPLKMQKVQKKNNPLFSDDGQFCRKAQKSAIFRISIQKQVFGSTMIKQMSDRQIDRRIDRWMDT